MAEQPIKHVGSVIRQYLIHELKRLALCLGAVKASGRQLGQLGEALDIVDELIEELEQPLR